MPQTGATVNLQTGDFAQELAPYTRYLVDDGKDMSIEQVLRLNGEEDFTPVTTTLVDFGFNRARFWLRIPVRNGTAEKGTWKLAVELPYIEHLEVYLVPSGGTGSAQYEQLLN